MRNSSALSVCDQPLSLLLLYRPRRNPDSLALQPAAPVRAISPPLQKAARHREPQLFPHCFSHSLATVNNRLARVARRAYFRELPNHFLARVIGGGSCAEAYYNFLHDVTRSNTLIVWKRWNARQFQKLFGRSLAIRLPWPAGAIIAPS